MIDRYLIIDRYFIDRYFILIGILLLNIDLLIHIHNVPIIITIPSMKFPAFQVLFPPFTHFSHPHASLYMKIIIRYNGFSSSTWQHVK